MVRLSVCSFNHGQNICHNKRKEVTINTNDKKVIIYKNRTKKENKKQWKAYTLLVLNLH